MNGIPIHLFGVYSSSSFNRARGLRNLLPNYSLEKLIFTADLRLKGTKVCLIRHFHVTRTRQVLVRRLRNPRCNCKNTIDWSGRQVFEPDEPRRTLLRAKSTNHQVSRTNNC
jgi:hypothetical protein